MNWLISAKGCKKCKLWVLAAALAVLPLLSVSGCGENSVFLTGSTEARYRTERVVYLPMEKVRTLNPMISKDVDTYYISKLIYDGLFELDEHMAPQKRLVDDFVFSEDRLTLAITLKQGVMWHDGAELTAQDVKFSIDAYLSLSYGKDTLYSDYVSNIKSVALKKSAPYELDIYFRSPGNVCLENLVFPILPAHQFKKAADVKKNDSGFTPIGTGPYKLSSYNDLSKLSLAANEDYFGDAPKNELEFIVFPNKKDALNLLGIEGITILFNDETDRDTLTSNMKANTVNFISNQAEIIAFNMSSDAMSIKKVRQAVACAVDSKEILASAYLRSGVLSDTLYYPFYYGNKNEGELYGYDMERAKALVREAGLKDLDGDGFAEDRDGNPVTVRVLVNSDNQPRTAAAQIIKNALDKLPFDSYIIYCSEDEYAEAIEAGDYDMYIGGYSFNERYDLREILHSEYGNGIGYSNPALDEILDEMQSGVSNARKAEIFEKANAILNEDLPYYCILYKTYGAISSNALVGEVTPLFNDFYKGCAEWECKYEMPAAVAE
ncbi:MAG: ABC transporter substrate-binding protein [Clostridiales bacterium]|nr:ABC transporter substrate-binding protein [Clostridiales bacterium]